MEKHEHISDSSSPQWAPPHVIVHAHLDFTRMKPVPGGAFSDGLCSLQPNFVGGRRDGQLAPAEWQPYRRAESGQPLNADQQPPEQHYILFITNHRILRYIHTSLLPTDYQDPI